MKTIIVATDYSSASQQAVYYAVALAQRTQASLVLYHAFFLPIISTEVPVEIPRLEDLMAEHSAKLADIAKQITSKSGVKADYVTGPMPVMDGLPQHVRRFHADLVVMGIKGLNAFDRRVFGSTTTTIIGQAHFPVLVVPEEATLGKLKHILFACDYSSIGSDNKLSLLRELALTFDAQVRVLHVDQPEPTAAGKTSTTNKKYPNLEGILEGIKHHYEFLVEEDSTEAIQASTEEYKADLLVMVPQTHGFWDIVMNRSVTRKIAFQTHTPLLTLPNPTH